MFQVFHLNVTKVNLGCCICCNGNIRMLQTSVLSVSGVSDICFKCFKSYSGVKHVANSYTYMFQVFYLFSDVCCINFI
jgi:hypothetical protein